MYISNGHYPFRAMESFQNLFSLSFNKAVDLISNSCVHVKTGKPDSTWEINVFRCNS